MKTVLLILFLTCGCLTQRIPIVPKAVVGELLDVNAAERLLENRLKIGRNFIFSVDNRYSTCEEDWVIQEFLPAFKEFRSGLTANKFKSEARDCDDYVLMARVYARAMYSRNHVGSTLLFGEFYYSLDKGGKHVTNFFVTKERKIVFFSPQLDVIETLSETETKSCYRVIF